MAAYLKHLAWWTFCGTLVVALAGALAGAATGGIAAGCGFSSLGRFSWNWDHIGTGVSIGGIWGAYSGAICGTVALLVLAIARPPLQRGSARRLRLALGNVGFCVLGGTFVLGAGTVLLGALLLFFVPQADALYRAFDLIIRAHFLFVALPTIAGALSAGRALSHLENEIARVVNNGRVTP